ncbi:MAG: alpha/beta fold hydrolase [Phycisphaerales bacterium]|nr:alpha/beta fold hydrolase [Phycisphaerales bacterium]
MADPGKTKEQINDLDLDREMESVLNPKKSDARRPKRKEPDAVTGTSEKNQLPPEAIPPFRQVLKYLAKVMLSPIIRPMGYSKKKYTFGGGVIEMKRPWWWLLLDGLLARLLLAPVILAIFLIMMVHANTHPVRVYASITPSSLGLYFKQVQLVTVDEQVLRAWYVPPLSVVEMALDPATSSQQWPAVVLCHGMGATQEQYLPLAERLHQAGFAVLMVDMRGLGASDAAGVTYGLREPLDVLAGVQYLRELPNIDSSKVCVVGRDIGAMAALQEASLDSTVAAVVADGMWPRFEDRAQNIFSQPGGWSLPTGWLASLYTAAFEIAVRDHVQRLDPMPAVRRLGLRPVLFVARLGDPFVPIRGVMELATSAGVQHEMMVAEVETGHGDFENRVSEFLMQATGRKGVHANENRKVPENAE